MHIHMCALFTLEQFKHQIQDIAVGAFTYMPHMLYILYYMVYHIDAYTLYIYLPHVPQHRDGQPFSHASSHICCYCTDFQKIQKHFFFSPPHMLKQIYIHIYAIISIFVSYSHTSRPYASTYAAILISIFARLTREGVHWRVYNLWRHS